VRRAIMASRCSTSKVHGGHHDLVAVDMTTPPDSTGTSMATCMARLTGSAVTQTDPHGRHDYAKLLEGRSVVDTTRRAFEALAALL
jgi:hypothetical protein